MRARGLCALACAVVGLAGRCLGAAGPARLRAGPAGESGRILPVPLLDLSGWARSALRPALAPGLAVAPPAPGAAASAVLGRLLAQPPLAAPAGSEASPPQRDLAAVELSAFLSDSVNDGSRSFGDVGLRGKPIHRLFGAGGRVFAFVTPITGRAKKGFYVHDRGSWKLLSKEISAAHGVQEFEAETADAYTRSKATG
ncbi:MAG: hypothetical protein PHF00_07895 [Elusimicrobia bacterium]|nr:hypothetical protein [Elusimicrobiota bacterium]